jgi:CMP-N,N'-diacetyllegionaminic acid synthase
MDVFALVTARSGSKGIPNKNLKQIGNHSLLEWSIKSALKSSQVTKVFLSTDSADYAKLGESFGAIVPFLRPAELASDTAVDLDVFKHFLTKIKELPPAVVHIRPTTPLRNPQIISDAVIKFIELKNEITSLRSVNEMSESAYKTFEVSDQGLLKPIASVADGEKANLPRQAFPKTYQANGYVDVLNPEFILKEHKLHGDKIFAFKTPVVTEVDSLSDLEYLNWEVQQNQELLKLVFGDN